jgi:hypothetical protein
MASQSRNSKRKGKARASECDVAGPSKRRCLPTPTATQQLTLPFAASPTEDSTQIESHSSIVPLSTVQKSQEPSQDSREETTPPNELLIAAKDRLTFDANLSRLHGQYRERQRTKRNTGNARISWIFKHGMELEQFINNRWQKRLWLCKYCYDYKASRQVWACDSTHAITKHLGNRHQIHAEERTTSLDDTEGRIESFLDGQYPLQQERWQNDFINWIAHDNITFEQAASPWLRKVILGGGQTVQHLLPTSSTVKNWIIRAFKERKSDVKASVQGARSRVNISFDSTTALNDKPLLAIVGHWIDRNNQMKTALLAIREPVGHHGADLAPLVAEVLNDYNIGDKLGALQMDNADNNDTCLQALSKQFDIAVTESRLRCQGHNQNLVVKALLFGEGVSQFQKELAGASNELTFQLWRRRGAIGRLHNLVVYITRSPARTSVFNQAQQEEADEVLSFYLRLKKDTGIRWNSVYTMIERALKLRRAIERYCHNWQAPKEKEAYNLQQDFLDTEDWEELHHFKEILEPFHKVTKRVEGRATDGSHGALWEVLPTFDYLFKKLQRASLEIEETPELFTDYYRNCVNTAFVKLREYYTKTDDSRLYRAAVALHPCHRYSYFERNWSEVVGGDSDIQGAKNATQSLFNEYLERARLDPSTFTEQPSTRNSNDDDDDWQALFTYNVTDMDQTIRKRKRQQETELERFLEDDLDVEWQEYERLPNGTYKPVRRSYMDCPLRWWRERGESKYPTLAVMAYDLLSIPAMSSECERIFSGTKRVVTDARYQLKVSTIEADMCLKSWLQQRLVDGNTTWKILNDVNAEHKAQLKAQQDTIKAYESLMDGTDDID